MTERQYRGAISDHIIKTYPNSTHALQITQPNWTPTTPMQEIYLKHVKDCTQKFDMSNYNNHNYWMRAAPRRPFMTASYTRLNDGVLPQGPKLLMFATFALPVTLVVDLAPFLKGWVKRLHNSFHGNIYQRVVDIPKFAWYNTATVNRMGVIYVGARFLCRALQFSREQSYLISCWLALWLTLPVFYRMARIAIPTVWCGGSYCLYKYLEHRGHINVLGIRRGRRSREIFALKTTRFRMRTSQERLVRGHSAGFLAHFFKWHAANNDTGEHDDLFDHAVRLGQHDQEMEFDPFGTGEQNKDLSEDYFQENFATLNFWHPRRADMMSDDKFNPYPEWYYGKFANMSQVDYDLERDRPGTRDRAWMAIEHMRNTQGIKFRQPKAFDIRRRELDSVNLLNKYLDERFWADPNKAVHGQAHHKFEHYLESGDNYFF